jgi:DNA helicase HerA-like ATPase
MSIFEFSPENSIGEVRGVDTSQVFIKVISAERLAFARVGRLVAIQGLDSNEWLIGIVNRVWRDPIAAGGSAAADSEIPTEDNSVQIALVGTYRAKHGLKKNYFTRAVLSLPDINRNVYPIEEKVLEDFMGIIGTVGKESSETPLEIGRYTLDKDAKAYLDADKLFQRHAALLGSTGSGKSWAVANILEQASKLENVNIILFDMHGEYRNLPYAQQLRIANPSDTDSKDADVLFLPYWLLNFDEMQSLFIDHSEQSAPNQSVALLESVTIAKQEFLTGIAESDSTSIFTIDSPIPFELARLIEILSVKNSEINETGELYASGENKGKPKTKQGPLNDKLTRMIIRLRNKISDRRYGFLFQPPQEWNTYERLHQLAKTLMGHKGVEEFRGKGVKVIDFSEVPSDILPIIVSLVARVVYQIQFWSEPSSENGIRHPILLVCDEAHVYLPKTQDSASSIQRRALENFERIAKEGRKYGVGLFVVSQRPSDVSTTILSQCNNFVTLRLTNERDKNVVKGLLPDSLGGMLDILPSLEVGEAIVVGDAVLLPTRICLNTPTHSPRSSTIDFWQRWKGSENPSERTPSDLTQAVENLRRQSRRREEAPSP